MPKYQVSAICNVIFEIDTDQHDERPGNYFEPDDDGEQTYDPEDLNDVKAAAYEMLTTGDVEHLIGADWLKLTIAKI